MSILIVSNQKKLVNKWIQNYIKNIENRRVNILNNVDIINLESNKKNLSTKEIKQAIKETFTKPYILKNKYLLIYNFNRSTIPAQNALLKTLEESNTKIILIANAKNKILDTILSRVKTVYIKNKEPKVKVKEPIIETLNEIIKNKEISKIKKIIKKDEEALLNALELFIKMNPNPKATEMFYEFKKRSDIVLLNKEIQITAILLNYFDLR